MANKIPTSDMAEYENFFKLAHPSDRTIRERNKFASQLDDFATFYWANIDMFAEFGAFIINEKKGSLKLYNGPSFKNTYSKPQFQDGHTNLVGVTFDTQTIQFTIGIYWISIEDYRILMNLLHPYEVNMLSFSFEKTYGYFCKLQGIQDSTRQVIGMESTNTINTDPNSNLIYSQLNSGNTSGPRYYTELKLTFEVIGAQCAKEIEPIYLSTLVFSTGTIPPVTDNHATWSWESENGLLINLNFGSPVSSNFISDLDYPIDLLFPYVYMEDPTKDATLIVQATLSNTSLNVTNTQPLFKIGLKNVDRDTAIALKYNSEHGIIYWELGNQTKSLNLLSTQLNGQRILKYIDVYRFFWPGQLNFADIKTCNLSLSIISENLCLWPPQADSSTSETDSPFPEVIYTAQRRTNII